MDNKSGIKYDIAYKHMGNKSRRIDLKYHFVTDFYKSTGKYIRSGIIKDGKDSGKDPYRASFPHLIDVGIMGSCQHGKSGLCRLAGIGCYQSGGSIKAEDMSLDDFKKIADESEHLVDQFALGGRGDPDCHKNFAEILEYCNKRGIVPNYTTSGFAFNKEKAELSRKYCGAVAVSWYRSDYTARAISLLLEAGCKTNIHYVLSSSSIDEATQRLRENSFPSGINAVIFLLHKPIGEGSRENMLACDDIRLSDFFDAALRVKHPYKIGFDSCTVPALLGRREVDMRSVDSCEGARFSMYISSDMIALPCSFDVDKRYGVSLNGSSIKQAWESDSFNRFRESQLNACLGCDKREACYGGCPLDRSINLCGEDNGK